MEEEMDSCETAYHWLVIPKWIISATRLVPLLLHGTLKVDDRTLNPRDFFHAEASVDHRVWSETVSTCVLMTSTKDVIA